MNCTQVRDLMSSYLDDALVPSERAEVESHLTKCSACTAELTSLAHVVSLVHALPEVAVPAGFHRSVMAAVAAARRASEAPKARPWARVASFRLARVSLVAAALVLFFGLGMMTGRLLLVPAPGPAAYQPPNAGADTSPDNATVATGNTVGPLGLIQDHLVADTVAGMGRQVTYSAKIDLQVQDVRAAVVRIANVAQATGGYVEQSKITTSWFGRVSAYMKFRVPQANFQSAVDQVGAQGKVVSNEISAQDVTANYVDVTSKLISLQTQEQQLLGLLRQTSSVDDIVKIQKELEDVRSQIETMKGAIQYYDQLVAFSTVEVDISRPLFPWLSSIWAEITGLLNNTRYGYAAMALALPVLLLTGAGVAGRRFKIRLARRGRVSAQVAGNHTGGSEER